jgi:hypothetical protein
LREEKNCVAEATEEIAGRQLRACQGHGRSSPDKRLFREEGAERRGTSAKRPPREKVAQQRIVQRSRHPFIHGFTDSWVH